MPIELVIADSNRLSRLGLSTLFQGQDDIHLLAEVSSCEELKCLLAENKADVVLIDYTSDNFSVDSVAKVKRKKGAPKVVAITPEQSGVTIVNALKAGVDSYIKKDCDLDEILNSVKETGRGSQFFCGQILDVIKKENIDTQDLEVSGLNCLPVVLSNRETEVIKLIAEGYTNSQIAEKLFLSGHTVNTHRKNIMSKLGVKNTAAIVMYAVKSELVSPNKFLFSSSS